MSRLSHPDSNRDYGDEHTHSKANLKDHPDENGAHSDRDGDDAPAQPQLFQLTTKQVLAKAQKELDDEKFRLHSDLKKFAIQRELVNNKKGNTLLEEKQLDTQEQSLEKRREATESKQAKLDALRIYLKNKRSDNTEQWVNTESNSAKL